MTEWRPVVGYEGLYEVSDDGQVYSVSRKDSHGRPNMSGRILKAIPSRGRPVVHLMKDGVRRNRFVYHLVLEAFVGPRPEGMICCHYDDDASNNHLSNLRWDTTSSNAHDCVRLGNHPEARRTHCKEGHPYSGANLYINPRGGSRVCRICQKRRHADRARELREAQSR